MRRMTVWIAIGIILLAWAMRTIALNDLPPGIDRDVATNGVYTLYILHEGLRPLFYRIGAIEPLIVYLQSISVALFGVGVFSLRLVTATIGTLAVPLLYTFARALKLDRWIALLAALGFALGIEAAHLSRLGLRAILVPLFMLLILIFFWRGWCKGHLRDFVIAGIFLGASIYTYISAVFFPLLPIAFVTHQSIFNRATVRQNARGLLMMIIAALIVAAPMLGVMLKYPNAAFFRASQVTLLAHPEYERVGLIGVLALKFWGQLKMFGVEWEGQYNPLSQPLLDPVWFVLLVIGASVCLWRFRKIEFAWAPMILFVMLLPDLIGGNEPFPQELRVIGVIPPAYFIAAVGAVTVIDWSKRSFSRIGYAIAGVALVWSAFNSFDAYFNRWGTWAMTHDHSDFVRGEVAEGKWITNQREPVIVPLNEYARQPVRFLAGKRAPIIRAVGTIDQMLDQKMWLLLPNDPARFRFEGRAYFDDPAAFVLIRDGEVNLLPPLTDSSLKNLYARIEELSPQQQIRDELGQSIARAFLIEPAKLLTFAFPSIDAPLRFGSNITLLSSNVGAARLVPGNTLPLSFWWQASQRLPDDYVLFAHLIDPDENVAAGIDVIPALGAYPTILWKPGEIVPTHHWLRVPQRTPPGRYRIEIGLYNLLDGNRLDVIDERGNVSEGRWILGAVKIAPRETATYNPHYVQRANFENQIALIGYDFKNRTIILYFQALTKMERDYTLFAHLLNSDGEIVAQSDHQPQDRLYPTSIWDVNEQVRDEFTLEIPANVSNGKYTLEIGWYDVQSGERLYIRDANNQRAGDAINLMSSFEVNR